MKEKLIVKEIKKKKKKKKILKFEIFKKKFFFYYLKDILTLNPIHLILFNIFDKIVFFSI